MPTSSNLVWKTRLFAAIVVLLHRIFRLAERTPQVAFTAALIFAVRLFDRAAVATAVAAFAFARDLALLWFPQAVPTGRPTVNTPTTNLNTPPALGPTSPQSPAGLNGNTSSSPPNSSVSPPGTQQ